MASVKLVVPDGSMEQVVTDMLTRSHILSGLKEPRTKYAPSAVSFIETIRYQRPQIIPQLVKRGRYDLGIAGEDWIAECGVDLPILFTIPRGRSTMLPVRIVLAVKHSAYGSITDLPRGCTVVSEYPLISKRYCQQHGREDIEIVSCYGHSEAIEEYDAEATIELTERGDSLRAHNLREIDTLMTSNTVVVANPESMENPESRSYIDCLVALIAGAWKAQQLIYLIANVPRALVQDAATIMGGMKAPTVSPTTKDTLFGVAAYVPLDRHVDVILELTKIGITDIGTFESGIVTSTE
ncbi:MAG: phosphoribosyltransferase (homohexameric) [Candidatus Berkelbacteria bacterium]|nr:phosphoribosyltransferase (homohexameric) [Candidatus Berkelbacteria bacterium]